MSQKVQKTIEINAKVKTSLEGMEKTVSDLEKGLEKQKFDLNKNSGLSKLIKDYKEAKAELDELMSGDVIARTDIKKAEQLGGKVSRLYKQIGESFEDLRAGSDDTFRKLFPDSFTARISKGTKAIEGFFSKLDSKSVKEGRLDEARKDLARLDDELDGLKNRRLKIEVDVDKKGVKDELDRINKDLEQMRENFKKKLIPEEKRDSQGRTRTERLNSAVSTWSNKLTQDNDAKRNLKVQPLSKSQSSQISKLEGQLVDAQGASLADIEKKRLDALHAEQTKRATIAKTPGARDTSRNRREYGGVTDKELAAQIAASEKELQRLGAIVDKINDIKQQPQRAYDAAVKNLEKQIKTDRINLEKAERALEVRTTQKQNQEAAASQKADDFMAGKQVAEATQAETDALKALNNEKKKNLDLEKKLKEEKAFDSQKAKDSAIDKKNSSIEKKKLEIQELENTIKNLTNDTDFDAFFKKLKELGVNTEGIDKTRAGLEGIKKDLDTLDENTLKEIREALKKMGVDAKDTDTKVDTLTQGMEQLGDKDKDLKRAENEMENLKNQVLQFFSLTNSVQLFKRAVTGALNTVKELDATMTEAAVVTDFSVGDMWDKLPEYSANAQKLGVSINGMYQATTLYYQQGLKTNEAMALGIETMKMGKIASMDSTEATKAMTAALRGFNMELNETSATRVNDVYSQLAAVTAADTNQIATAMEKTASIAAAANMEFETTAALLAQIIETTQEAPETAGTAMKTIIARFSEVKALQNQGEVTGTDEEGESIDVNKIQTALKTVGISMDNFFAGTEGLDSILLKLAEKWNTLDFETQRYVATMAAGSRQQSRFIAMMSDYGRTMELVDSANNSAGASQRQYEKTLDSMESKLQRLENAWNEFLMSLANNDILKGAVDFLTWIVEGINKMTDSISGGNGLIKSITSLITVIGALKLGKQAIGSTGFAQALGGLTGKAGTTKETITETKGPGGSIVRTIVKEPVKEGELAGQQAGQGFVTGFKRAIDQGKKKGFVGGIKGFFGREEAELDAAAFSKRLGDLESNLSEDDLSQKALDIRSLNEKIADGQLTVEQAAEQYQNMGYSLESTDMKVRQFNVDMQNVSTAAFGVGGALGLLSTLFSNLGMEPLAQTTEVLAAAFMGLGTIASLLTSIFPALGNVAITAGGKIAIAGWESQLAWWWVVLIIAAIGVLIGLFVALAKSAKENSIEGQMKAAAEATERAKSAAEDAKEAYDSILSSQEEYNKLQNALEGLTRGTEEWKEALVAANNQVLELLKTYPTLAQYLERGSEGQLSISDEGWDKLITEQKKSVAQSTSAIFASQMKETRLASQKAKKTFQSEAKASGIVRQVSNSEVVVDSQAADKIYEAYQENGAELFKLDENGAYSQALQDLALETGHSADNIYKLRDALVAYDGALISNEATLQGQAEAMLTAQASDEVLEYEYSDQLMQGVAKTVTANQEKRENEISKQLYDGKDGESESKTNEYFKQIAAEQGLTENDFTGDDKDDLEILYAKMAGINRDEIAEGLKGDKKKLAQEIARLQAANEAGVNLEKTYKRLSSLDKKTQLKYVTAMSGDTKSIAIKDARAMGKINTTQMAKDLGYADANAMAMDMGYTKIDSETGATVANLDAFNKAMQDNLNNASNDFAKAFNTADKYGISGMRTSILSLNDSLMSLGSDTGLTIAQTKLLSDSLSKVAVNGGDAREVVSKIPKLLEGLSGDALDAAMNLIANADWTTQESIDATITALEGLGANIDQNLVKELYNVSKAVKSLNLEKIDTELKNLQKLIDNVESKAEQNSKVYTKEERDALINAGFDENQFVRLEPDEYVFMGTTEELLSSIEGHTSQILNQMGKDLDYVLERGKAYEQVFNSDKTYGVALGGNKINDQQTAGEIISKLATGELDVLGVGTRNNVTRETLEALIRDTGTLRDVNWEGYSDQALADALVEEYANYYGPNGATYKGNIKKKKTYENEQETMEYADLAGTDGFYEKYWEDKEKLERGYLGSPYLVKGAKNINPGEYYGGSYKQYIRDYSSIGGKNTQAEQWVGEENYRIYTEFDPLKLLESVATQEDFTSRYLGDDMVTKALESLAVNLGVGTHDMDIYQLQEVLTNYYESANHGDEALDALITSETGLDLVLEQVNEELSTQGINCEENSAMVKQLVLTSNQANKSIDKLNDVLEEQGDILKNADKKSDAYKKSLSLVTNAAKEVFGKHIDAKFIEENIELFEDLAEGGETAAAAWKAISEKSGQAFLSTLNLTEEQLSGIETQMAALDGMNLDIGGSANFSDIFTQLANVMNSADEAEAYIESLGGYEVEWVPAGSTINELTGEEMPNYIAIVKKTDQTGTGSKPSTGGGGGGDKWENPYDKLHNVLEEINDLLREREKLERRYQRLISQGTATAEKLSKISNDNINNYQDEIAKQEYVIAGRKAQVQAKIKANSDMEKYVYTDIDAMGNETIRIDWDAINGITDSEEGEKVSEFYDNIDEWLESIYDAENSILDAEDAIWEELQQGKDEYLDLEEQVKEAIVKERQEEIDKLSAINDSINDTNSKLIESMQSQIDKYRQDRENQETEKELSNKQRRLAYLQQDTSGSNDLEIMKLQEEIDQGQQDYTDSLIDQKISELQEQNDKAAEQRQQQIDIMQAQLDKYVESGEIWQEVSDLIATGTDAAQNLVKGSELETLLKSSAGFEGMSNVQKMAWLQDTNVLIAQALKWLSDGAVSSFSTGQEVTFKTGDGKTITGKANAQGEVEADGQIYKDVSMDAYGNYSTKETVEDAKNEYTHRAEEKKKADEEAAFNARFPFGRPSDISRNLWRGHSGTDVKALQQALNELGFNAGEVDGIFGGQTWSALTKFKNKYGGHGEYGMQSKTKAAFKAIEYKTGGLVDFTGPAWLDGTRSKPEYILNADQTKAFFTLVDVLGSLQAGNSKTAQNSGDNTYDIDINVESIGSDYDVEQLATTVKRLINEDARYRNNNAINLMR